MARVTGVVVTDRDRILISYIAIARYASTAQVQRLVAEERDPSIVKRRLRRLCSASNRPGASPPLRKLEFKRAEGTAVAVWALTQVGRAIAEDMVPYLRPPGKADVGAQFLQHTLMLNDVLVDLAAGAARVERCPAGRAAVPLALRERRATRVQRLHGATSASPVRRC